ncbi:putative exported lipoprotein [Burkholderia sp. H160]|nr:putative exported lipoprotein [Burkholderia sp. H160]
MRYSFFLRQTALLAVAASSLHVGLTLAQEREAPIVGTRPAMSALTAQPATPASGTSSGAAADSDVQGYVAELIQMIHDAKLTELRTTYNGSYGATLFFYPLEMTYYVALFQDRHFWRVIKSQDEARAEAIYAGFVQQTAQLAEVEIRRTQLEAQNALLNRGLAQSADRARSLQADLDVARTQQAQVDDRQRRMQAEATALRAEKVQAQAQLRELQRQVDTLQRQNEAGLPGAK